MGPYVVGGQVRARGEMRVETGLVTQPMHPPGSADISKTELWGCAQPEEGKLGEEQQALGENTQISGL